jgi:hypothetical protein
MAKKKGKRKKASKGDATNTRIATSESTPGMSASALANFTRDLAAFGSRAQRQTKGPAR